MSHIWGQLGPSTPKKEETLASRIAKVYEEPKPGRLERLLLRLLPYMDIRGEDGSIYLRRFYLYRGKRRPHVYVHHIFRSDDDRALHDHPWDFTSVMLAGEYDELVPSDFDAPEQRFDFDDCYGDWLHRRHFSAPAVIRHKAVDRHRLKLPRGVTVWTIVFAGPRLRDWGFWMKGSFIHWEKFTEKMKAMGGRC